MCACRPFYFAMTSTRIEALRQKAGELPLCAGVYLMKNKDGTVIYVGKSRHLRARVLTYFTGNDHPVKTARMVSAVHDFDYIVCDSEIEALGLENTLIKKYAPRYNIKLKDAKSYPYIKISAGRYPSLSVTRERKDDGGKYFGPYQGTSDAYKNLDTVRRIFFLPSCKRSFPDDIGKGRPCLYKQMNRCLAPCAGCVSEKEFSLAVKGAERVLGGDIKETAEILRAQMTAAAEAEEYEAAARIRDAISALGRLRDEQKVLFDPSVRLDAWALYTDDLCGAIASLSIRHGVLSRKNEFSFPASEILTEEDALAFIGGFYEKSGATDMPKHLLLSFDAEDESTQTLSAYLSSLSQRKVTVSIPVRGEKHAICEMAKKNAIECAEKYKAGTMREEETLVSLASLLALEIVPSRIEVYDISNIGAEYTTAAMIVYEDGRLRKNEYRTFRIQKTQNDDYGAMREALSRRFAHKGDADFGALPDLILLDGGHTHVAVGKEALGEAGLDIPLFGLVKDAFHKTRALCDEENDIGIAKEQSVFVFLYKLQEEVHRFAVSRTMGAKQKSLKRSTLEDIPGIGKERAKLLLSYFGNMRRIKEASLEELCAVKGMTVIAAQALYAHYRNGKSKKGKEDQ